MHGNYLYTFNYDSNESEMCKLESRYIFQKEEKDKTLFSDVKIEPSISAFIKRRLDVIVSSEDYSTLIDKIKKEDIHIEGFKVEYLTIDGDTTGYREGLGILKDIGYSIEGIPDYYNPTITYAVCNCNGVWYFGVLNKNSFEWHNHRQKPHSYSNSISMKVAKALINIATKTNKELTLLDACCGVGTIMLEACFAGHNIEGCEINEKIYEDSRENLAHFNYSAKVYHSDIKDITKHYDAAIVDLPYNLFSHSDDDVVKHILASTVKITNRMVIVSISDISEILNNTGMKIIDSCTIQKRRKANFHRRIWVCKKIGMNS